MPGKTKPRTKRKGTGKPKTPAEAKQVEVRGGVVVAIVPGPAGGDAFNIEPLNGTSARELPTLLRQAANFAERQLVGE